MLDLFVWDAASGGKVPAIVKAATEQDLAVTKDWQTSWEKEFGAIAPARYDPYRMIILEEAAAEILSDFMWGDTMDKEKWEYLQRIEEHAAETGWVAPLTQEDKDYFAYLRAVSKRYNIRATRLEYDFVIRVAESEFYLQRANA